MKEAEAADVPTPSDSSSEEDALSVNQFYEQLEVEEKTKNSGGNDPILSELDRYVKETKSINWKTIYSHGMLPSQW